MKKAILLGGRWAVTALLVSSALPGCFAVETHNSDNAECDVDDDCDNDQVCDDGECKDPNSNTGGTGGFSGTGGTSGASTGGTSGASTGGVSGSATGGTGTGGTGTGGTSSTGCIAYCDWYLACSDTTLTRTQCISGCNALVAMSTACRVAFDSFGACVQNVNGVCSTVQMSCVGQAGTLVSACGGSTGSCPYTNDNQCDEPEGTGLCAEGTDVNDCVGGGTGTCRFTGDGECDEPEGTGFCAQGTDVLDCGPNGCIFAYDGECDEPNLCTPGTDTADCG